MAKTAEEILAEQRAAQQAQQTQQEQPAQQTTSTVPTIASEADIDRRFTEMMMRDAQADKEREEKRLRRQESARVLSDIGGVISDMIKASEGAVVSPRKLEAEYNQLSERQKQLYDTYRARTDLLRKQQQEQEMQRNAAQRAADQHEADKRQQMQIAEMQNQTRKDIAQLNNEAKIQAARERAAGQLKARTLGNGEQVIDVPFAGTDYPIQKKVFDGRMAQLYAYLDENNLFPEASQANDDLKSVMALIGSNNSSMAQESSKSKLSIAVMVALAGIPATSEHAANIISILNGGQATKPQSTGNQNGNQGGGQQAGSQSGEKQKKKIRGVNGN